MPNIQVIIVEDDPIIAEDIKEMLSNINYSIIGIAYTKNTALDLIKTKNADLVLLDINLNGHFEGLEIATFINETKKIPFVYLTSYSSQEIIDKAKTTLPMGYIVKPFNERELYSTIEIALYNFSRFQISIEWNKENFNKLVENQITQKEFEILIGIYEGKNNLQLAESNFISVHTVKTHIKNIFEKLNTHTRSETIALLNKIFH